MSFRESLQNRFSTTDITDVIDCPTAAFKEGLDSAALQIAAIELQDFKVVSPSSEH